MLCQIARLRARLPDCRIARLPDFTQKAVRLLDGPIACIPDLTQTVARLPDVSQVLYVSMKKSEKSSFDEFPKLYWLFKKINRKHRDQIAASKFPQFYKLFPPHPQAVLSV